MTINRKLNVFEGLVQKYRDYIAVYEDIYNIEHPDNETLDKLHHEIKLVLINKYKIDTNQILSSIDNACKVHGRFLSFYWNLFRLIYDEYPNSLNLNGFSLTFKALLKKVYEIDIELPKSYKDKTVDEILAVHENNSVLELIMNNKLRQFQRLLNETQFDTKALYHHETERWNLLEWCSYYGNSQFFKFLRLNNDLQITEKCLELSFLGGNPEIMLECLKYFKPTRYCMENAIASHNFNFIKFLKNNFDLEVDLDLVKKYDNLHAFLIAIDSNEDIDNCFIYSPSFFIPSLTNFLLEKGANINASNGNGYTCLHTCAKYNSIETAKLLLNRNCDPNKAVRGFTTLHLCAEYGSENNEMIKLLIDNGADPNKKDNDGESPLHICAANDKQDKAKFFIENGAEIDLTNNDGYTPLHIATIRKSNKTAKILIENGADINKYTTYEKKAPLHLASMCGAKEIAQCLISHGAVVNDKDDDSFTPLHLSERNNNLEVSLLLLQNGADVNAKNYFNNTPLHYAATVNLIENAKILLDFGADLKAKNSDGMRPIDIAKSRNNTKTAQYLIERYNSNNSESFEEQFTVSLDISSMKDKTDPALSLLKDDADIHSIEDQDVNYRKQNGSKIQKQILAEQNRNDIL
ncbi:ankyrin repeat protein, putative [Trichomonas vaginalis G3]|uniref:Ankyrin repeat protein, putative n=1 Tax=Trichomonas vaginalis (strain ATCC PRA-98 / G3) TaxID=412133 RepID=A2E4D4_TRIV3|nr:spectrin binding [Trichomonas vaginalis G3]EAY12469.1 ankyrin repeat protein, putative [Trichomonas vaginalis G3]KAI5539532.1 spectrin binding [Trichomonas vaginalis G3]|eukprot:XP_001324692.1 ankyrin repeat protein [Trichomonas vaginalis G3]